MSIIAAFSKLCVSNAIKTIHRCSQQQFHMTPIVYAEPMKKRKRLDPAIIKSRIDRRKRKIEKAIRRLQKNSRQLKPIEEVEKPKALVKIEDQIARKRPPIQLNDEQRDYRALLQKDWTRYKRQQNLELNQICKQIFESQNKALQELRLESEVLYQAAIQPDENLLPVTLKGPVNTPPIKNYDSPDGEYKDVSKKWD
ncbi:39S ribosomal protein L40, mitochondrial [Contarinia nasturtii]|uniref:39S ribosomal protein L40, mitochondrial n=1 Tax=Contarinia nasturtii TaxID=265458 RepID=UPI0012D48FBD|nr:39S ribosomal protein L40, mitochondrial [Contarinia nasturtii]